MRCYSVPINADVADEIGLDLDDFNTLAQILHVVLLAEYELKLTGALPSAVKDRGHACNFWEVIL